MPVIAGGFATGAAGGSLAALGSATESAPAVLIGLVGVGAASGTALLARTAAGDMYPPERRARGIALVLFGNASFRRTHVRRSWRHSAIRALELRSSG